MARRQSAAIYFRGTRHKEIYYQGHYHDELWLNGVCLWKKLSGLFPSSVTAEIMEGLMGSIGSTAYSVTCATDSAANTVTITITPWTDGTPGTPVTITQPFDSYTGEAFYGAGQAQGMLIAAAETFYGRSVTDPVVYISKNGSTFTAYTLPGWTDTKLPTAARMIRVSNSFQIDAGVIDDVVLLPGTMFYSTISSGCMQHRYFLIDTNAGQAHREAESVESAGSYYAAFWNDKTTGNLYAMKVSTEPSSGFYKRVQVTGIDIVKITAASISGGLTETLVCSLDAAWVSGSSPSAIAPYLHTVNGRHFFRSGRTLSTIDTTTGAQAAVLTLPASGDSFCGDVCYNGTDYLVLTRSAGAWVGYRSADGLTWTEDATITDGASMQVTDRGNSVFADGGIYTGGWAGRIIYAAE